MPRESGVVHEDNGLPRLRSVTVAVTGSQFKWVIDVCVDFPVERLENGMDRPAAVQIDHRRGHDNLIAFAREDRRRDAVARSSLPSQRIVLVGELL
jgi:hypothetical protein